MIYTVLLFNKHTQMHSLIAEDGDFVMADLFVDATFHGMPTHESNMSAEEFNDYQASLVGKKVEIEKLEPLMFYACNVKIIEP